MKLKNRLRVLRAEKRVTQEQLEHRTRGRISQTKISLIERDGYAPTATEQRIIARALRVSVEEVFPASVMPTAVAS
jgi:DNA-binding XRE family transcriptional regulator